MSGGIGGLLGALGNSLPQVPPPDPNEKPKTYDTGTDPTAKEAGKNPSATVYTATQKENAAGGLLGLLGGASETPVTPQDQKADSEAANQIVDKFDGDNQQLAEWFGQPKITDFSFYTQPAPSPDSAGAGHTPPQAGEPQHYEDNITVNLNTKPGAKLGGPAEVPGLADAEAVESYEDRTGNWNAGLTNGEALSRALAFQLQPAVANDPGFSTKPMQQWWKDGHKDYINGNPDFDPNEPLNKSGFEFDSNHGNGLGVQTRTQAGDQNPDANGSGTLFLQYMHDKLGYSWNQIIGAKGNTLGEKYQSLSGKSGQQGFQDFVSALPKTKDKNGNTILNLPPDGNPFQQQSLGDKIKQGAADVWNKIKGFFSGIF